MNFQYIKLETPESGIAVITLNNPENLNALGVELARELKSALTEAGAQKEVRVIILMGAGRAFSSGGNLKEMRENLGDASAYLDVLTREVYGVIAEVPRVPQPVIAAVKGAAMGAAFNLVLACDLVVAAEDAVFSESFIRLGLIPGGHGTILLPRLLGDKRAAELSLTGRNISAPEALNWGLINRLVPADQVEETALTLARELAAGPPLALRKTKELLYHSARNPIEAQARLERISQVNMARTDDYQEGVKAFFEKRKPEFKGK